MSQIRWFADTLLVAGDWLTDWRQVVRSLTAAAASRFHDADAAPTGKYVIMAQKFCYIEEGSVVQFRAA